MRLAPRERGEERLLRADISRVVPLAPGPTALGRAEDPEPRAGEVQEVFAGRCHDPTG
jgi:hypothetical protein